MLRVASAAVLATGASALLYGVEKETHVCARDLGCDAVVFTDYLGDPEAGKAASAVNNVGNATSYSGFFRVDEQLDSNMYGWYFPPQNEDPDAPTILWLQGGPGSTSLYGLFDEMGPFYVDAESGELAPMPHTWNEEFGMLFIDNPVGTGFSYTGSPEGYATNELDVAVNLHEALTQFFTVFEELQQNEFYVAVESYGGKYGPAVSYVIDAKNQDPDNLFIPLAGLSIGDGWSAPDVMVPRYKDLLWNAGLIDDNEAEVVQAYQDTIMEKLEAGDMLGAYDYWDRFINGDLCQCEPYVMKVTGLDDYFNYLQDMMPPTPFGNYVPFVTSDENRCNLHIGNATFGGVPVEEYLEADVMVSMLPQMPKLVENYKVLIYNGQLDLIVGAPLGEAFASAIEWSGQEQFAGIPKQIWKVDGDDEVAGYVKAVDNLTFIVMRGAGHMVPTDQPVRAKDMLTRWIRGEAFTQAESEL